MEVPSVLCTVVGRQERHPACKKLECWGAGMVICLGRDADLHMAQLMPLPLTASCFSKIQIGFTFLVPAHLGSPGKRAVKRVCVLRMEAESRCSARPLRWPKMRRKYFVCRVLLRTDNVFTGLSAQMHNSHCYMNDSTASLNKCLLAGNKKRITPGKTYSTNCEVWLVNSMFRSVF